jgi:CxxC motif-containing protein (DUF1111 family)
MSIPGTTTLLPLGTAALLAIGAGACSSELVDQTVSEEAAAAAADVAVGDSPVAPESSGALIVALVDAPAGFDLGSNGVATEAEMEVAADTFAEQEFLEDGLGPVYNATSCGECHQNPNTGGQSQISEFRAGHFNGINFVDHPGGSLMNDRAIDASIQERIAAGQEVRTFRMTTNLFGAGFIEAIDSNTLQTIANGQPAAQRGTLIQVPIAEAPGNVRAGRFGWKNQHASLLSFAADAYLNEMGITSPLQPTENTSNGNSVAAFDGVADPEDDGEDLDLFALFMRSLKVPPRDDALAATPSAQNGSNLFNAIGCATCHVRNIDTAPAGTVVNGGAFTVPDALGSKTIHPFSDFLMHNVGTGDGIVQNGGQATRNQLRTPPLWGMRVRPRLMHDGATVSRTDAILRHAGQASTARNNFASLSTSQQSNVIDFLNSL